MSHDPLDRWREQSRSMPYPAAVPPPPASFEDAVAAVLADIKKELAELRDVIRGRPDIGWQGALARIEGCEKRIDDLTRIQEEFVRERKTVEAVREKKEATRVRIVGAALSVGGTLLVTVVIAVFKILVTVGTKAPP